MDGEKCGVEPSFPRHYLEDTVELTINRAGEELTAEATLAVPIGYKEKKWD